MIVLVGLPGSGKTQIALNHFKDIERISQDDLGSRDACVERFLSAVESDKDTIIDRCNISIRQRSIWLKLAKHYGVTEVECINVTTGPQECYVRAIKRKDHPTIKDLTPLKIRAIINSFNKEYEPPTFQEGFTKIIVWEST